MCACDCEVKSFLVKGSELKTRRNYCNIQLLFLSCLLLTAQFRWLDFITESCQGPPYRKLSRTSLQKVVNDLLTESCQWPYRKLLDTVENLFTVRNIMVYLAFLQDDASCHGEETQSLLEANLGSQLKSKCSDWRAPALILGESCYVNSHICSV